MIELYSGTPGSGKSLDIARRIILSNKYKQYIMITNFETKPFDTVLNITNQELTPKFLIDYSQQIFKSHKFREDYIILVIDEAQLLFNSREWNKSDRMAWISFFTQHRKLGYKVILCTQYDRMLDRQIRALIEYEVIHRKISNLGWKGKLLSIWFGNRLIICVRMWYPLKEKVNSEFLFIRKKYYSVYDSYHMWVSDSLADLGIQGVSESARLEESHKEEIIEEIIDEMGVNSEWI